MHDDHLLHHVTNRQITEKFVQLSRSTSATNYQTVITLQLFEVTLHYV